MKPQPKRLFSSIVSVIRVMLAATFVILGIFALNQFKLSQYFPISTVRIYGGAHMDRQQVHNLLLPLVNRGFFAVKVDTIRDELQELPWVSDIFVRRNWPDKVEVTVIEKKAIALWNENALLSDAGEIFTPREDTYPGGLPRLIGPIGKQILMLQTFKDMNRIFRPLHVTISYMELTPYLNWKIKLSNGVNLQIGQKELLTRVGQLVRVFPKIVGDRVADVDYIDLRYPNGMAVRWKEQTS